MMCSVAVCYLKYRMDSTVHLDTIQITFWEQSKGSVCLDWSDETVWSFSCLIVARNQNNCCNDNCSWGTW